MKRYDDPKDPETRTRYGQFAGVVGICCNMLLAGIKIIMGIVTGAISIAADALNNLSDAVSSVVTLIGFRVAARPADKKHPYGHGRAEYLSGFVVSAAVIAVAVDLFIKSVSHIIHPAELDVSITTIVLLVIAILVKCWMAIFYTKISRKIDSRSMLATAADSRNDVITTAVALISVIIMLIFRINIDGYAGAVVAIFVFMAGIDNAKDTIALLLGEAPDEEKLRLIKETALGTENVLGVHDIRVHEYGPGKVIASLHVEVPYTLSLLDAHEVADVIEHKVQSAGLVTEMTVHVDPVIIDDEVASEMEKMVKGLVRDISDEAEVHDFRYIHLPSKQRLSFDAVFPYGFKMTDKDIAALLEEKVKEKSGLDTLHIEIAIDRA